jgi:hypothetical protein
VLSIRKIPILTVGPQVCYATNFHSLHQSLQKVSPYYSDICHGLTFPHRLQFTTHNQHLVTPTQTYPDETRFLNKEKKWKKREEADKNKGIASISNQKCKVYKTFNVIIIVLRHEPNFFPTSAIRCYNCSGYDCRDPYTGISEHTETCAAGLDSCATIHINNGKRLHNRHLNIYIRQSRKFSQNI